MRSSNVSNYIDVVLRHLAPPSEHQIWKQWALREIFSPDQVWSVNSNTVSQGLLELSNMILYRAPVIFSIRNSYRNAPVYLYNFAYRGQHHRFEHVKSPLPFAVDASLSDDNVYVFPYPVETSQLNAADRSLSRALVTMWVNFATTGVPNPNSGVWPRASSEYGPVLRFSNSRENVLELDPHFGEGINIPNLYGNYFNTTSKSTPAVIPVSTITPTFTTTTTTTTRRPYVHNPYNNWQNRQSQQTGPSRDAAEEARRKQEFREYQLRQEEERRREYQLRLQQRQEQLQRESLEREKKLQEQQQQEQERQEQERERQQREQQQREQQWREQQWREQQQRKQPEQQYGVVNGDSYAPTYDAYGREITPEYAEQERQRLEAQQREQERREYAERLEQERQQREREQQEREQQEREQQERNQQEGQYQPEENSVDGRLAYPSYDDYEKSQQGEPSPESDPEEQQGERERLEQERQLREQEHREYEERLEQERQQREREQQERDQQGGQQQPEENPEDGREPYPSYEDYVRTQNGEQSPESDPERNYAQEQQREQERLEQERQLREQEHREYEERLQREREQQEREQEQPQGQPDNDPSRYPSYEEYLRSQQEGRPSESDSERNYDEEQEREQQRRDQLRQEQEYGPSDGSPGYPEESAGQDQEYQPDLDPQNDPSNYATYEDYVKAQLQLRVEEEERDRALREEEERQIAQAEAEEEAAHHPAILRKFLNAPRQIKLISRQ